MRELLGSQESGMQAEEGPRGGGAEWGDACQAREERGEGRILG